MHVATAIPHEFYPNPLSVLGRVKLCTDTAVLRPAPRCSHDAPAAFEQFDVLFLLRCISAWLLRHRTCPNTGQELSSKALTPNYAVKALVERRAQQPAAIKQVRCKT